MRWIRMFMLVASAVPSIFPAHTLAQGGGKNIRIGIYSSGTFEQRAGQEGVLLQGLKEQGYVEGKNLQVERRYLSENFSVFPETAQELAGKGLDAIVTTCTGTTYLAKQATSSIPIIMAGVSDPIGQKLIASFARPGQNVTGLSSQSEDLLGKRLQLMADTMLRVTSVAVLANSGNSVHDVAWKRLADAAKVRKIRLIKIDVKSIDQVAAAFDAARRAGAQAIFVLPDDPILYNAHRRIVDLAAKQRMPDFYWTSDYVEDGGLMSYGESIRNSFHSAASYIVKVARGANPAEMPVEQPTQFELVINLRTAKTLGIKIPEPILLQATRVIE